MNFGEALQAMKEGHKISRSIWGGYWYLATDARMEHDTGGGYMRACGFKNIIVAVLKDNGGCAPAQPYQADILADDWKIVD